MLKIKATGTPLKICNIYLLPRQERLRERSSILLYTYIYFLSCMTLICL